MLSVMNLSKWMSWRKQSFFRRRGKHVNSDVGEWTSISVGLWRSFNSKRREASQETKLPLGLFWLLYALYLG